MDSQATATHLSVAVIGLKTIDVETWRMFFRHLKNLAMILFNVSLLLEQMSEIWNNSNFWLKNIQIHIRPILECKGSVLDLF